VKGETFGDLTLLEVNHEDLLVDAELLRNRNTTHDQEVCSSGRDLVQSRQGKEEKFAVDSRRTGRDRPDLGGDVELVDEADLLGELLASVGGQVQAHLL
jgi:hypothetical protein